MFSPFFLGAFVWNFAHGLTNVLVPLYALDLGYSGMKIGSLLALPVVLQLVFNLIGGAYVDRIGAKNMLYASCVAIVLAATTFQVSDSFGAMMLGFSLFVLSRASFWPANYALGSQLPGDRSRNMGWLNSVTNAGQISGTAVGGMLIVAIGFKASFWLTALTGLAAYLLNSALRANAVRRNAQPHGIFETYRRLATQRAMYFGIACAFLSVLPFTIVASFGAILLVSDGYSTGETGWLLTLRAIGAIFAGAALARVFRAPLDRRVPLWSCTVIGAGFALLPVFQSAWPVAIFILMLGISSGVVSIYFQLLISALSPSDQRGSAISFGGIGWNLCNFVTPLAMGAFMDAWGIRTAFYLLGALMLGLAAVLAPLYRWALPAGIASERGS